MATDHGKAGLEPHVSPSSDSPIRTGEHPDFARMSVGQYIATRIPTLMPPLTKVSNPFRQLRLLSRMDWLFFLVRSVTNTGFTQSSVEAGPSGGID